MTTNGRINHHRELFPSPSCLPVVVRAEVLIIKGLLFQQYLLVRPKERTHWAFFFYSCKYLTKEVFSILGFVDVTTKETGSACFRSEETIV